MTEYAARTSQNHNSLYINPHFGMSHYSNGSGSNYFYNNGQIPYSTVNSPYSTYSHNYLPAQNGLPTSSSPMYMHSPSAVGMQYQTLPPSRGSYSHQSRNMPHSNYPYSTVPTQRQTPRLSLGTDLHLGTIHDTEPQESHNQDSMLSEPLDPPLDGYPDVKAFDDLMKRYVADLSPKKQDKALIHAKRAANIRLVLIDKKTTNVESAQFRFWVKKMFALLPNDPKVPDRKKKICHEGKPVAIREKLFKILIRAHKVCQHGGRDKTSAQVRRVYSWVPKELISRFVKLCPTCQVRRGASRASPPESEKSPEDYGDSPETNSPYSRRDSTATKHSSKLNSPMSIGMSNFGTSATFASQNRWMTGLQNSTSDVKYADAYSNSTGTAGNTHYSTHGSNASNNMNSYGRTLSHLSFDNNNIVTAGFPSSNVRSTNASASWKTSPAGYGVKQENHYQ